MAEFSDGKKEDGERAGVRVFSLTERQREKLVGSLKRGIYLELRAENFLSDRQLMGLLERCGGAFDADAFGEEGGSEVRDDG